MPKTICLIYNVYFAGLQHSAVKIQQQMCRIRAHKNHLKLKCTGFSEISSQYARNIHAEDVAVREFFLYPNLARNSRLVKKARFRCKHPFIRLD